jgi:hypothetical protein
MILFSRLSIRDSKKRTAMEDKGDHPLGEKELLLNTMTCPW